MGQQNAPIITSHLVLLISLAVKPSAYRWLFFPPIVTGAIYTIFWTTSGNATTDYVIGGLAFGLIVKASDFILLTDVQTELRRKDQLKPINLSSLPQRTIWALDLCFSPRMIGWNVERPSILPPKPRQWSRSSFIMYQLWRLMLELLMYDAVGIWNERGPSYPIYHLIHPIANSFDFVAPTAIALSCQHRLYIIVCIASGRWKSDDFPSWYGDWRDAYTLRRLWGRTWHQGMRRMVSSHGKFLARKVLGLRSGGNASAYIQLYTAFFISGLIHYACDYCMLRDWTGDGLRFFLSQAVAIHFEDIVIAVARRVGLRERLVWKVLGYVWVWLWFAWRIPSWQGPILAMGYQENTPKLRIIESSWSYIRAGLLMR